MEQPTDPQSPEDPQKDTPPNVKSPKSASARFKSFLTRDKDLASSSNLSPSPPDSKRPHSVSSPNLLSLLSARNSAEIKPFQPSKTHHFPSRPKSPLQNPDHLSLLTTTSKKGPKHVPIYMYLDDECFVTPPSSPIGEDILDIAEHDFSLPSLPELQCIPLLTISEGPPSLSLPLSKSASASPISSPDPSPLSSPRLSASLQIPRASPPVPRRNYPSLDRSRDNMTREILASPLIGNPSPALIGDELDMSVLSSPTIMRKAPPRVLTSSAAMMDNDTDPSFGPTSSPSPSRPPSPYPPSRPPPPSPSPPTTPSLSPSWQSAAFSPSVTRSPRPPPSPSMTRIFVSELNRSGKDLDELPDSTFSLSNSVITKLFLSRNHLTTLPPSVSLLNDLTFLDLSYNKFERFPPPSMIASLPRLKELLIQGNYLFQTSSGLDGLSTFYNLRKLDLSSNQIENPSPELHSDLFRLTGLHDLSISHNSFPLLPPDILYLTNLTAADLSHNSFTQLPPEIGSLIHLKKLNLKHNQLTTLPDEISSLLNLTELDLSHNSLSLLPTSFASLYNLLTLQASHNRLVEIPTDLFGGGEMVEGEDGQMWVQGMFALMELRLRENLLTSIPDSVTNLVELKLLDLTCNELERFPFAAAAAVLPKLENLSLADNKIREIPDEICSFPNLEILNVSSNQLTCLPHTLWQVTTLRLLSISYNNLTSLPLPPPEESWRSLEELFAAGNPELKEIAKFGELSSLREFYLQNCGFLEIPLMHSIGSLPYLEKLDLSNNKISFLGPDFFNLEFLSRLAISHNEFANLPLELSNLRRIEYLDVSHNKLEEEPEAIKVMRTAVGTEVITTGNPYTYTQPKPDCANATSTIFEIAMSDLVGRRPTMEDTFSICSEVGGVERREVFGIFDGHAGSIASHFVAKYLKKVINNVIETNPNPESGPLKWLELAHAKLVDLFRQKLQASKVSGSKHCGTTGLILMVDDEKYYVANVGDTRAVLSRGGKAIRMSTDDKPCNPEEEKRIRDLGGFVVVSNDISRVNGTLAVSRSIGDFYMHPYVTATPHLYEFARDASDEFIVLACDGVWDEIGDQLSVDIVKQTQQQEGDLSSAAFALRDKAYAFGSDDNISVMLLKFKNQS